MKFEIVVNTEQGLVSTITENALEAQYIMNGYRFSDDLDENVSVVIMNKDSGEFYSTYMYSLDNDGLTKRDWSSIAWLETIAELLQYGGYNTEEVM